jgi:hypothetical protein
VLGEGAMMTSDEDLRQYAGDAPAYPVLENHTELVIDG